MNGGPSEHASRFSARLPPDYAPNALSRAMHALRASGRPFLDLTESNPTAAGLPYPEDLLDALSDARALRYEPHPLGLWPAREAVSADFARRGSRVDPAHVVLSASTSEAYSWLFKLLCNPGECVLVPQPSYPLFEHLTRLEGIRPVPYALEYHGRWDIDFGRIESAPADTRALLVVSPNNPTGSFITARELARLAASCRNRGWALVVDEVFADYPLEAAEPITDISSRAEVLCFTLGGASKSLGLPQVKLGWMHVGGPPAERDAALEALEMIADSFLSVSTPVQMAAPTLLQRAALVRQAIHARLRRNLATARELVRAHPSCDLLRVEGGWSTIVRLPATRDEEAMALELVEQHQVLVHPGYFFDMPRGAFLITSLLAPETAFAEGFRHVVALANS